MVRRQQARHELYHDMMDRIGESSAEDRFKNRCMDWCLGLRCVLHSASRGIRWALALHATDDILDDLHLCIKSARNTSDALHRSIPAFVSAHMQLHDSPHSREDRIEWWIAMGVSAPMIDWVMSVDPRYEESTGHLNVSRELYDTDCFELVCEVVQFFLRWTKFSDTRWAGVGPSSKHFVCSLAVGLPALRDFVDRNAVWERQVQLVSTQEPPLCTGEEACIGRHIGELPTGRAVTGIVGGRSVALASRLLVGQCRPGCSVGLAVALFCLDVAVRGCGGA